MPTLDELRATLDAHADALPDTAAPVRAGQVDGRIRRAVRRRRAVTAAGVAAVVAVVATAVATIPGGGRQPQPAGIPDRVSVFGFGFDHQRSIAGDPGEDVAFTVPQGKQRTAVSFTATGLGSGRATLWVDDQPMDRLLADGTSHPMEVWGGKVRVDLDGAPAGAEVSLNVYQRKAGEPVFRDRVDGRRLLAQGRLAPGKTSLTVPLVKRRGMIEYTYYCETPAGTKRRLYVEVDGQPSTEGGCDDPPIEDAGAGNSYGAWLSPGHHQLTAWVEDAAGKRLSDVDLGLAAYAEGRTTELGAADLDQTVEYAGRRWTLDRTDVAPGTMTPTEPVLLGVVHGRKGISGVAITMDGRKLGASGGYASGGGWALDAVLLPGSTYRIAPSYLGKEHGPIRLFTYRLANQ